jgi:hypothetical protein
MGGLKPTLTRKPITRGKSRKLGSRMSLQDGSRKLLFSVV